MHKTWDQLINLENIYRAWKDFSRGKRHKPDVINFASEIESELFYLLQDLQSGKYHHGGYEQFKVFDPKKRIIHKAVVRDRIIHRLLYNYFLPIFDSEWLDCSFSCRPGFGQHCSVSAVEKAIGKVTRNYTRTAWAVKCDIKKFFNNINHLILRKLLVRKVFDQKVVALLDKVVASYWTGEFGCGIPIGNLTSQIFANVYLHELDIFVKHRLRLPLYFRYADDFIFLTTDMHEAEEFVAQVGQFLSEGLHLTLHPKKIVYRQAHHGIDWLGQVILPGYKVIRPSTRRRVVRNIRCVARTGPEKINGMLASYHGLLSPVANKSVRQTIEQIVVLYGVV